MSDIFQEVDEALKQEKAEKFWHDHKEKIVAAILVLIIGAGGISFYKNWNEKRDGADTEKLIATLEDNLDADTLPTALNAITKETRDGVSTVGQFLSAGIELEKNKKEEALNIYKNIIDQNDASPAMEDLARVLKSQYHGDHEKSLKALKPILADKASAFHWHARLQAATIEAETNKDYKKAISYLQPFEKAEKVSATLKQRAAAMLHIYQIQNNQTQTQTENKSS